MRVCLFSSCCTSYGKTPPLHLAMGCTPLHLLILLSPTFASVGILFFSWLTGRTAAQTREQGVHCTGNPQRSLRGTRGKCTPSWRTLLPIEVKKSPRIVLRILIPWCGIGSILTSASKIFLLKSQLHSFSLLMLISPNLRKRWIILPAAAPQKHREQQAASNGRHLLCFGLLSQAFAIPSADTRSHK